MMNNWTKSRALLASAALLFLVACTIPAEPALTEADVLAISEQHQQAWNNLDTEAIIDCYTANAIVADTDVPPFHWQNHEGVRQWLKDSFKSFKSANVVQDMRHIRIINGVGISTSHFAFSYVTPHDESYVNNGWVTEVVKMTADGPKFAAFHASPIPVPLLPEFEKLQE